MAKNLSPADLVAALESMGMPIPDDLQKKVANEKSDLAETKILGALATVDESDEKKNVREMKKSAEAWRADLFTLAERFESSFVGERRNVGQGNKYVRVMVLDTPNGTFTIKLVQD